MRMSNVESRGSPIPAEGFESIEEAVMETPRGRWFLSEYAARVRAREFKEVASQVKALESAVTANHDAIMSRIALALGQAPAPAVQSAPAPGLAPRHMKFFTRDEDIFEAAPQAEIAVVKPALAPEEKHLGAKLTVRRLGETEVIAPEATAPELAAEIPVPFIPPARSFPEHDIQPAAAEETPKRRIVIIRHKPGETVDVPLQNEMAQAS